MKKKYKNRAEQQDAYRERLKAKKEAAAEIADAVAEMKGLNLCGFGEIAFETPARTWLEEVQIHRSWLQAFRDIGMDEPDVLQGESLRDLARRTWQALLRSEKFGLGVSIHGGKWTDTENGKQWVEGFDVWYPLFSPSLQHFQIPFDSKRFPGGPFGEVIHDGARPDWFDAHWIPPKDCTTVDDRIDIEDLPSLPPVPIRVKKPEPKQVKPPEVLEPAA